MRLVAILLVTAAWCYGETSSALFARGYTVLPTPQKVTLGAKDFEFTPNWRLDARTDATAGESLDTQLQGAVSSDTRRWNGGGSYKAGRDSRHSTD